MKYLNGYKKKLYYSSVNYWGLIKNAMACIFFLVLGFVFLITYLEIFYLMVTMRFDEMWKAILELEAPIYGLIGGAFFLLFGAPYFAYLTYVEWVQMRYLWACASGNMDKIHARTEPTIRALLRIDEWRHIPAEDVRSLPEHDPLYAADCLTIIFVIDYRLLKKRNLFPGYEIKITSMLHFLQNFESSADAVRFVTNVGCAEFPKEQVLHILQQVITTKEARKRKRTKNGS